MKLLTLFRTKAASWNYIAVSVFAALAAFSCYTSMYAFGNLLQPPHFTKLNFLDWTTKSGSLLYRCWAICVVSFMVSGLFPNQKVRTEQSIF